MKQKCRIYAIKPQNKKKIEKIEAEMAFLWIFNIPFGLDLVLSFLSYAVLYILGVHEKAQKILKAFSYFAERGSSFSYYSFF